MANIRYRGSTVPTDVNAAGGKNAALTNTEIDQNFFALDRDKLDKGTAYSSTVQTVAGPVTFSNNIVISGSLTVGGTQEFKSGTISLQPGTDYRSNHWIFMSRPRNVALMPVIKY